MFQDESLVKYLKESSSIQVNSIVTAEWNMNNFDNISQVGNYRYRSTDVTSKYRTIPNNFDPLDSGNFYTNATNADTVINGGVDNSNIPILFYSVKEKEKMLYSLNDCFAKIRPRSGINKARFFKNTYSHYTNMEMSNRPRYYMASKDDVFKYWSSYRTEDNVEYGIANNKNNRIYDAAPFVIYKDPVPTNKIVIKMQTNVGSIDLGPFNTPSGSLQDPFYGSANKTTPEIWKVQYLDGSTWVDAISFNKNSTRLDGSPVIKEDGYVELSYGLRVPEEYSKIFNFAGEYSSGLSLPINGQVDGDAYLVKESSGQIGTFYIWISDKYERFQPKYNWHLSEETISNNSNFVTNLTDPDSYTDTINKRKKYTEFEYVSGLRIVVETMNKTNSTFDLIELSPRLSVDLSDKVKDFSITKQMSDIGSGGLPVGKLLAANGSISLFDYDLAFSKKNDNSIIHKYVNNNLKINIYEKIGNVSGIDYVVPIKTMYSDGFPKLAAKDRTVSITLRDLYFYLESMTAPKLLIQNASVSYAVSLLLDSIGFSNYSFKRNPNENEVIIPYFFVAPDKTVAEVLQDIAVSTQTAMFFDEYNNFIMMSKDYIMPTESQRTTDITLYGSADSIDSGILENEKISNSSNIISINSSDNDVYNDGVINYTTRYIQRTYGSIKQASQLDVDKTWVYKPSLLWEVSGTQNTKSQNDETGNMSTYALAAIALNSDLSSEVPIVKNNTLQNNIIDLGESVYWITRYNGYFYANGEIIKYDAVEFSVPGTTRTVYDDGINGGSIKRVVSSGGVENVWITSVQEYQQYFANLPFNGKIYPTGRIRIYSEPEYITINGITKLKNGAVTKHGRGQFGTEIVSHNSGLDQYWSNDENVRGCNMDSSYIFTTKSVPSGLIVDKAGVSNTFAKRTTRNGIIKNFLSSSFISETEVNGLKSTSSKSGTVQSSALVMNGPSFTTTEKPNDFVSYVYKPLNNKFKHFGTRLRIIGKITNSTNTSQWPVGSNPYYAMDSSNLTTSVLDQNGSQYGLLSTPSKTNILGGASGGLAVMVNPETNVGYYFELIALTDNNINSFSSSSISNIIFYKVKSSGADVAQAIPEKLWGGLSQIIVDDGSFVGQSRMSADTNSTVYDLAVEYENIGTTRRFYLYINNKLIATVDDQDPLPVYNNMALFVRGSSRLMFENIYAVTNNYSQNTAYALDTPANSAFDDGEISVNEAFRKYALSGMIQSTYLSGISPSQPPTYNMYFEEFGTILREAAYMNIRYDKAYPALYAKISPTFNRVKGYTVSGFTAGAYGAEFMVFNATDSTLSLDETTGNYLRIQGVAFTQESKHQLTVDQFFAKNSDFSNPSFIKDDQVQSPIKFKQSYQDIKNSRLTNGKKDFSLETSYIQTQDDANNLMKWMISKITKPRKSVEATIFGLPVIQLGDIVSISYKDENGIDQISSPDTRFIVYKTDYKFGTNGPETIISLSEVV